MPVRWEKGGYEKSLLPAVEVGTVGFGGVGGGGVLSD